MKSEEQVQMPFQKICNFQYAFNHAVYYLISNKDEKCSKVSLKLRFTEYTHIEQKLYAMYINTSLTN